MTLTNWYPGTTKPVAQMADEYAAMIAMREQGHAAGQRGERLPRGMEKPWRDGWRDGRVRWKIAQGKAIGFVSDGTSCKACKQTNWGWRLGCRCNGEVEWGWFIITKDDLPHDSRFMRPDAILAIGLPVLDLFGGKRIKFEATP